MSQPLRGLHNITFCAANKRLSRYLRPCSNMASAPFSEPIRPIHWILDWDGTITRRDTLDALVSIAASAKPDSPVLEEWQRVSDAYMSEYNDAIKKLAPGNELPKTVQDEKRLLLALSSVEQASLDRVSVSGIFAGLTRQLVEEGTKSLINSKKVELRKGFASFLDSTQKRPHDRLDLLSVNWSRQFIGACLKAADKPVQKSSIYANELDGIESNLVSQGHISPKNDAEMLIISSADKLRHLNQLRNQHSESSSAPTVYIGDSWTDIECLLEADLGICIRDEPLGNSQKKLADRLQSLGVRCPHLSEWRQADEPQVVWARDFTEIQDWVGSYSERMI
jgi:2-hydroxy-3-keto-5-methylthiopentenyl-1-phosphate phosphatase